LYQQFLEKKLKAAGRVEIILSDDVYFEESPEFIFIDTFERACYFKAKSLRTRTERAAILVDKLQEIWAGSLFKNVSIHPEKRTGDTGIREHFPADYPNEKYFSATVPTSIAEAQAGQEG
jgi:hypothetical protein